MKNENYMSMWNTTSEPVSSVSLTFDGLDEQEARALTSWRNYYISLWELDQWLRSQVKYNDEKLSGDILDAYDTVRDKIRSIMEDNHCSLEDLS